jgi:uncharacterized membrane protein YvbJ
MFCQKCGKESADGAAFCDSCGASLTQKSTTTAADIQLKENEIRLLQEKFDNESSHLGPLVIAVVGVICCITIVGLIIGIPLIIVAWWWDNTKSAAATETEIKLNAAKAEVAKMK